MIEAAAVRFDVASPFTISVKVGPEDIDTYGHVNHKRYLGWIEDSAIGDTLARGFDLERFAALRAAWFVRRHIIDYFVPSLEGDELLVGTWPGVRTIFSQIRRCQIFRLSDMQLICRAETSWIYVDTRTGRPKPFEEEVLQAFAPLDDRPGQL
jgi:acyl-CoA thioester hydrolase